MVILDTNVVSEALRPYPSRRVQEWVEAQPQVSLYLTTISQAEMLVGARLLPGGRRRTLLESAISLTFEAEFRGRVLAFDSAAARMFATIVADRQRLGRPINYMDAQIAAIARSNAASIATRDLQGFANCGVDIIDPWQ